MNMKKIWAYYLDLFWWNSCSFDNLRFFTDNVFVSKICHNLDKNKLLNSDKIFAFNTLLRNLIFLSSVAKTT